MNHLLTKLHKIDFSGLDFWNLEKNEQLVYVQYVYHLIDNIAYKNNIPQLSDEYEELWREAHNIAISNDDFALAEMVYTAVYSLGMTLQDKKKLE